MPPCVVLYAFILDLDYSIIQQSAVQLGKVFARRFAAEISFYGLYMMHAMYIGANEVH